MQYLKNATLGQGSKAIKHVYKLSKDQPTVNRVLGVSVWLSGWNKFDLDNNSSQLGFVLSFGFCQIKSHHLPISYDWAC